MDVSNAAARAAVARDLRVGDFVRMGGHRILACIKGFHIGDVNRVIVTALTPGRKKLVEPMDRVASIPAGRQPRRRNG